MDSARQLAIDEARPPELKGRPDRLVVVTVRYVRDLTSWAFLRLASNGHAYLPTATPSTRPEMSASNTPRGKD